MKKTYKNRARSLTRAVIKKLHTRKLERFIPATWLEHSILLLVILVVGSGGVALTLATRAATSDPVGTIRFTSNEGSVGNLISYVKILTSGDDSHPAIKCTPNEGTTGVGSAAGTLEFSCRASTTGFSYKILDVSRDGYHVVPGGHGAGSTFQVYPGDPNPANGKNIVNIVMERDAAPPPDPTPPPTDPTPPPTSPGPRVSAPLHIHTYLDTVSTDTRIGDVAVAIADGGHSPEVNCTPQSATTGAGGTPTHGTVDIDCLSAYGGGDIQYALKSVTRSGYSFKSATIAGQPTIPIGGKFTFNQSGATIQIVLSRDPVAPTPTPPPTTPPPTQGADGQVKFTVVDTNGSGLVGAVVKITPKGSGACTSLNGNVNYQATGAGGIATFNCTTATASPGPKQYTFSAIGLAGYSLSATSPHAIPDDFTVYPSQVTAYKVILKKDATNTTTTPTSTGSTSPAPTGSTGTSTGSGSTGSTGTTTAPAPTASPTTAGKGSAQVTAYYTEKDGRTRTRLANVEVHIQAVNHPTKDIAYNCPDYNQKTDGNGTPGLNSNYGQVHYSNCPTNSAAPAYFQLSYVKLPAGYSFKRLSITGPSGATFASGGKIAEASVAEQFKILKNEETRLELLSVKEDSASNATGLTQIITQNGLAIVPVGSAANGGTGSGLGLGGGGGSNPPGGGQEEEEGDDPEEATPTDPSGLTAVQDGSGSIKLDWKPARSDNPKAIIKYSVYRSAGTVDDEEPIEDVDGTSYVDTLEDEEGPANYTYRVTAYDDDNSNESDGAFVKISSTKPVANVEPEPETPVAGQAQPVTTTTAAGTTVTTAGGVTTITTGTAPTTDPGQDPEDPGTDPTEEPEDDPATGEAELDIPAGAVDEPLACDISSADIGAEDVLSDIGTADTVVYTPTCREDDGDIQEEFEDDVDYSVTYDEGDVDEDSQLYGYDGTDWELIDTSEGADSAKAGTLKYTSAKKTKKDGKVRFTLKTKRPVALALIKSNKSAATIVRPTITLLGLALFVVAARIVIRRRVDNFAMQYSSDPDLHVYVGSGADAVPDLTHIEAAPAAAAPPISTAVQPAAETAPAVSVAPILSPASTAKPPVLAKSSANIDQPKKGLLAKAASLKRGKPDAVPTLPLSPYRAGGSLVTPEEQERYVVTPTKTEDK